MGAAFIHSEAFSVPVAGRTECAYLIFNAVAVFFLPCPGAFQKSIAADIVAGFALFAQRRVYFRLCSDTGMVRSRHP